MNPQAARPDDLIELGYIAGAHGVKGWVRVHSWTEPREAILDYRPWLLGDECRAVTALEGGRHGKTVIAALPGVEDRDQALALVRQKIAVRRSQLPPPPPGVYYWADLQGLEVVTTEGLALGRVARMLETGANDVMVLEDGQERLVPFVVGQTVTRVDLDAGLIEVDWNPED